MNQERLMNIILAPHISEKTTGISDRYRQFAFKVMDNASKLEIKKAVELMFKVVVESVNVCRVKPRVKRTGKIMGKQKGWKKAYVVLSQGHDINFGVIEKTKDKE